MRRLAWLFVVLPLALCQYQQQQQRYNQPQYPNQQYNQQQFNPNQQQQYGNQQMQQQQQNQQNQQQQRGQQQGYQQQNFQQQGGYQSGQYQQQYGQGQLGMNPNQQQVSGRSEVVNTPTRLMSSATGNLDAISSVYGAQIDLKLNSYTNQDLSLSNITTCSCPNQKYCDFLPSTGQNNCMFSFTTVISAKDQSVQFIQSDFYPFSGSINSGNWTAPMSFQMPTKPVAVDIFVQHLGVVIHKVTGALMFFNHLTLVDSFVVDMAKYIPSQNPNSQQYTLTGSLLKTSLQMQLSVQCINGRMGTDCDLTCDSTTNYNYDNVICTDSQGRNTSCQWNTYKTQVSNCIVCSMVGANGTCAQVITEQHIGVSHAFRTWTIVLGVLLGIAILFILCLIISFVILRNRTDRDETLNGTSTAYKQDSYANGKASRPLLEDEWAAAPRRPIMPERTDDRGYNTREANSSASRQEHQV